MDKYVELAGGLDLQTPPNSVEAGKCREAVNVYEAVNGGYVTTKGFERLDGGVRPSKSKWWRLRATRTAGTVGASGSLPLAVSGDNDSMFKSITALVQGFVTVYLKGDILSVTDDGTGDEVSFVMLNPWYSLGDNAVDQTELVGKEGWVTPPFSITNIDPSAAPQDSYTVTAMVESGDPTEVWDTYSSSQADFSASNYRKLDTREPLGDGEVIGVHQVLGKTIAWREDLANSTNVLSVCDEYTGTKDWEPTVDIVICSITDGTDDPILALSAASNFFDNGWSMQDVQSKDENSHYVALRRWNPSAALPAVGDVLDIIGSDFGTINSDITPALFTPVAGGQMESLNYNFFAGVDTNRVYFADGVNPPMYYDPKYQTVVPIMTSYDTISTANPVGHIAAFQSRLIASTGGGGFITSVGGDPMNVDGSLGSVEIGVGEFVTGFKNASANELLVFTTKSTWSLSGDGPATWTFRQITGDSGAKELCIVDIGEVFAADDVGIVNVKRADVLGGFTSSTVSNDIQRLYTGYDKSQSCSTVIKSLEQMRFFFGLEGLIGTRVAYQSQNGNDAVRFGFTRLSYPIPVICVNTDIFQDGEERTVFGSNTGLVYVMESGPSFDGAVITSTISTVYNNVDAPWQKKRFEALSLDTVSADPSIITLDHNLNDGGKEYDSRQLNISGVNTALYAVSTGASDITRTKSRLRGTGYNVQFTLTRTSADNAQVAITGYTLRYTNRGLVTI